MRWNIAGLLSIALACVASLAEASPIIYHVNISDGTETVAGTITTDGTLGLLSAADITGFSLSASGPISFGPITPGSVDCFSSCSVVATPTALTFVPIGAELDLTSFPIGRIIFGGGGVDADSFNPSLRYSIFLVSPYTIGQAQVSEPGSATLLSIALVCFGFASTRCARLRAWSHAGETVAVC